MQRTLFGDEHETFRSQFRAFLEAEALPHRARWEQAGVVDRSLFTSAGSDGFLGMEVPEEYGGRGIRDFRFNVVMAEEIQATGLSAAGLGLTLQVDICLPYFLGPATEGQRKRWLPGICRGELITAIAMTEPGAGSDLAGIATTARHDGHDYVVNGAKTFISNGINADLVVTAVKTDPAKRHKGMSLLVIERGMPGFDRGRNLAKMGMHAQDTAELFFHDVRVPAANRLGEEGHGLRWLMTNLPRERMSMAATGVAAARAALAWTLDRTRRRMPVNSSQNPRFRLAELATEVVVAEAFLDRCVLALNDGALTAEEAAMAKWWCTELQGRATNVGVLLDGPRGCLADEPIARAWADGRVTTIYGGTTEIMKEIIGRGLGL